MEGARGGARVPLPVFSAAVSKGPGGPGISENFFSAARARARSLSCISAEQLHAEAYRLSTQHAFLFAFLRDELQ